MTLPIISSPRNPLIQALRRLQRADERRAQRLFLIEGTHLVQEAIATEWPLAHCLVTSVWRDKNRTLLASIARNVEPMLVTADVLDKVATTEHPDGIVAVGHCAAEVLERMQLKTLGIAVERLQSPDNLGSLLRSSIAAGSDGVWVDGDSVDTTHPKVLRSSAGQWFRQPPSRVKSLPSWIRQCRDMGVQVLGASVHGASVWNTDLLRPTVFILGNEGSGLSQELQTLTDGSIAIPMKNKVESLNVSVAGAILLFETQRQRSTHLGAAAQERF